MAKKKHAKREIRLYFKDGKTDIIPGKFWDEYELNGEWFIVKRRGAWIAGYKLAIVDCFVVIGM